MAAPNITTNDTIALMVYFSTNLVFSLNVFFPFIIILIAKFDLAVYLWRCNLRYFC